MFPVSKSLSCNRSQIQSKAWARRGLLLGVAVVALTTTGCESLNRSVGGGKASPDEFAVVTKAPLVIPPDFSLRPPMPGARRPQEANVAQAAANAVFSGSGQTATTMTSAGETMLLQEAGADDVDNAIRDVVDSEYYNIQRPDQDFSNKVLFYQGETVDPGTLVKEPEPTPAPEADMETQETAPVDEGAVVTDEGDTPPTE